MTQDEFHPNAQQPLADPPPEARPPSGPASRRTPKAASISGFLGSSLEYYDFVIFGLAAALVFGDVFFPGRSYATLLSLATFGVAYIARPLGAIFWGHLGDRLGRSKVLTMVLLVMGGSTFLIGCLPSTRTIGIAAPILLVTLRLVQGLSAGGEGPGSALLAMEHAQDNRRGFLSAFTLSGANLGQLLATLAFIPVAAMNREALLSWGWRVPFWLSALIIGVTYLIRSRVDEPQSFAAIDQQARPTPTPIAEVVTKHWKALLRTALGSCLGAVQSLFSVWSLGYATNVLHLSRPRMLSMLALVNLLSVFLIPVYGRISDRIGRRPSFGIGTAGSILATWAYLAALGTGNWLYIHVSALALMVGFFGLLQGSIQITFLEMFPAHVRYSGMAVGNMLGLLAAGFTPTLAQALSGGAGNWVPVAITTSIFLALSGIAVVSGPEYAFTPTAELGYAPGVTPERVQTVVATTDGEKVIPSETLVHVDSLDLRQVTTTPEEGHSGSAGDHRPR